MGDDRLNRIAGFSGLVWIILLPVVVALQGMGSEGPLVDGLRWLTLAAVIVCVGALLAKGAIWFNRRR